TMARGDFSQKVKVYGKDEISQLAVTFNHLNDRLKHSIATTEQEQRKLSSVLEHMSEGVIATDEKGEKSLINEAAGQFFRQNPNSLLSKDLVNLLPLDDQVQNFREEQEQRELSSVLEHMSEGVIATDDKGEISLIYEAAGQFFRQNPNSLISKDLVNLLAFDDQVQNFSELQDSGSVILDFSQGEDEV